MDNRILASIVTAAGLLAAPAVAQHFHIRAAATDGPALAETLEAAGLDVLEGGISAEAVELIVTEGELADLRAGGQHIEVLAASRPFADIQAERRAAWPGDEPPDGYPTLDAVYLRMQEAAARRPDLCQFVDLTDALGAPPTEEGRRLFAVKLSRSVELEEDEPSNLIVSAHHAREIVTPVIALHAIDQFVDGYGVDPALTEILDTQEVWIAPVWNPDGYDYVFTTDNMWRKNRRDNGDGTFGVDQNRNYPLGWDSPCAGDTRTSSLIYKGPAPASEPETQTMMMWTEVERFARVLDFHSSGRETLYAYACLEHPLETFLQIEAEAISTGAGYEARVRPPSADGEHYEWQLTRGAYAFLMETHSRFQPEFTSAQAEAEQVFGGILTLLQRPISLTGFVRDDDTSDPLEASLFLPEARFVNGESFLTASAPGRYYMVAPDSLTAFSAYAENYDRDNAVRALTPGATVAQDFRLSRRLAWSFPAGRPDRLSAAGGDVIRVEVAGAGARQPQPGTGMLHIDTGAGFQAVPMVEVSPNIYDAVTPMLDCVREARYFFSVEDTAGRPSFAPEGDGLFLGAVGESVLVTPPAFGDLDQWTIESVDLTGGEWAFGEPLGDGSRGDPTADADGDGVAWLTDPAAGNSDVDGGPTRLSSPVYDLSGYQSAELRFARWFQSANGTPDQLTILLSPDDGAGWSLVERINSGGGWTEASYDIGKFIELTDRVRVRFVAVDNPNDSVTEAGIDAFAIVGLRCDACRADLTGDGLLDFFDFLEFQNLFGAGDLRADFDGNGLLDFFDFLAFQNEFGAGCP
ncbi:MAG: M14 family zinc carboxypeptidase [Phycisphaerales bacterium JB039]